MRCDRYVHGDIPRHQNESRSLSRKERGAPTCEVGPKGSLSLFLAFAEVELRGLPILYTDPHVENLVENRATVIYLEITIIHTQMLRRLRLIAATYATQVFGSDGTIIQTKISISRSE